jgi:signal peptidase
MAKANSKSVVTHRIIEITTDEEGNLAFITQGDANNIRDEDPIPAENVIGIYVTHINHAGSVAMFMSTTTGLIVCVVVPLALLIGYDVLRRKMYDKKKKASQPDTDALMAELEALKAEKAKAEEANKEE